MKIKIVITAAVVLAVLMTGSCSMFFGMSIESRIAQFQMDLNTDDRSNIIDNFSPYPSCSSYNKINTESYWNDDNSIFDVGYRPFSIEIKAISGNEATGKMIYGPSNTSVDIKFVLEDGGLMEGWKITEIWINDEQKI